MVPKIKIEKDIAAPIDLVFRTVSQVEHFSKAVPHIVEVEFLSDQKAGVGTRFRETRLMNGKPATTELEVTEYVENERVRIVTDSHGTIWDTVFTVHASEGGTRLEMVMDCRPHRFLQKIMVPLIKGVIGKSVEGDMDAVKEYCEGLG